MRNFIIQNKNPVKSLKRIFGSCLTRYFLPFPLEDIEHAPYWLLYEPKGPWYSRCGCYHLFGTFFSLSLRALDHPNPDSMDRAVLSFFAFWDLSLSMPMACLLVWFRFFFDILRTSMYPPCTTYEYEVSLYFSQLATTHVSFVVYPLIFFSFSQVDLRSTVTQLLSDANEYISKFRFLSVNFSTCILKVSFFPFSRSSRSKIEMIICVFQICHY